MAQRLPGSGDTDSKFNYSPSDLWKGFLELGETRRKIVRGEGGEAWINFKPGVVVRKVEQAETHWKNKMHSPKLWDTAFKTLLDMQVRIFGALIASFVRFIELLDMF